MIVQMTLNGRPAEVDVPEAESLLFTLRERLGLRGSKNGCDQGECGSCSVVFDGAVVCSCLVLSWDADGSTVTTVEGLAGLDLHPVQRAFVEHGAVQCGFCTPGFVVTAADALDRSPDATDEELMEALAGNLCRCTGYGAILRALRSARAEMPR